MNLTNAENQSRQHAQLRRLARAIVGESYADDVVQDVWAAALAHPGPAPSNWEAWMTRVTRNIAWKRQVKVERARAREVDRARLEIARSPDGESPEDLLAEVEEKHALERLLLDLDEPYRSTLLWRFYGGLSVKEIAEKMGENPSTTRTRIKRGVERLRSSLESANGPDWRSALVPLLGRGLDVGNAAQPAAMGGVGAFAPMLVKLVAVAAAALALFLGGRVLLNTPESVAPRELAGITPVSLAEVDAEETELGAVGTPLARSEVRVEGVAAAPAAGEVDERGAGAVKPVVPAPSETAIRLTEAASGEPLPGVTVIASYAYMKRRSLFSKSTAFAEETVTTDTDGRAVVPVQTDLDGLAASHRLSATLETGSQPGTSVSLQAVEGKKDGVVELQLVEGRAFRVRLPETLTEAESLELKATFTVDQYGFGAATDTRVFEPVAVNGRELLFVMNRWGARDGEHDGILHIATTARGRAYHAAVPKGVTLATAPIDAVAADDISHTFRLIDSVTGAPLADETVSVGRPTKRRPYASRDATGRTAEDGTVTLWGIPSGEVTAFVRVEGYEEFRAKIEPIAGSSTPLRLVRKMGLRTVAITLVGEGPVVPDHVDVRVTTGVAMPESVAHLLLQPEAVKGGGWSVSGEVENVPNQVSFLEAFTYPRIYDRVAPVRIEPGQNKLQVPFGNGHKLTKVRLRLPPLVEVEYRAKAGDGLLYSTPGTLKDGSTPGSVEDDGRPVTWIVTAPGYLPVLGSEADWRRVTEDGDECIEITPDLQRGWGALISVRSRDQDQSIPFRFRKERAIAGATIFDAISGETLGVTGESGYAVITAANPVVKIGVRYGDRTKTVDLNGRTGCGFIF